MWRGPISLAPVFAALLGMAVLWIASVSALFVGVYYFARRAKNLQWNSRKLGSIISGILLLSNSLIAGHYFWGFMVGRPEEWPPRTLSLAELILSNPFVSASIAFVEPFIAMLMIVPIANFIIRMVASPEAGGIDESWKI